MQAIEYIFVLRPDKLIFFYVVLRATEMIVMCKKQTHKPTFCEVCHTKFGRNAPLYLHGIWGTWSL